MILFTEYQQSVEFLIHVFHDKLHTFLSYIYLALLYRGGNWDGEGKGEKMEWGEDSSDLGF